VLVADDEGGARVAERGAVAVGVVAVGDALAVGARRGDEAPGAVVGVVEDGAGVHRHRVEAPGGVVGGRDVVEARRRVGEGLAAEGVVLVRDHLARAGGQLGHEEKRVGHAWESVTDAVCVGHWIRVCRPMRRSLTQQRSGTVGQPGALAPLVAAPLFACSFIVATKRTDTEPGAAAACQPDPRPVVPMAMPPRIIATAMSSETVIGSPSAAADTAIPTTGVASSPSEVVTAGR